MGGSETVRAAMVGCLRAAVESSRVGDHAAACEWAWTALSVCGADGAEFEALSVAASRRLASSAACLAVARQAWGDATVYRIAGVFAGRAVVLDASGRWAFVTSLGIEAQTFETWEAARLSLEALRAMESAAVGVVAVGRSRREWLAWDEADARAEWYGRQIGGRS